MFDSSAEAACYFADTLDLDEFGLELRRLAQNGSEACNLLVGHLKGVACAIGLGLCCYLSCGVKLHVKKTLAWLSFAKSSSTSGMSHAS
jgi:hypothetical protein